MEKNPIVYSSWVRKKIKFIFLMMKFLSLLIFAGSMAVSASTYSQQTKLDLRFNNSSLTDILNSIETSSEFIFIYNENVVNSNLKKSISVKGETIDKILNYLFQGTDIAYRIDDRQVFLYKKEDLKKTDKINESIVSDQTQKKGIKGRVTDSKGLPLPGATVVVKGTTVGTITDSEGNFILMVSQDAKSLLISFVGLQSQEIQIGSVLTINVQLKEAPVEMSDVVVVGYGIQKKQSVVGSIATATNADLMKRGGVYNLADALSGQMTGVTVMDQSGEPGRNDPQILIRGMSTWNGSQPLILVDGIERRMGDIDINEVDNISVLKDASATAVFGVKGANGVILITTKRGSVGKSKLSLSANTGFESVSKINSMMDAYEGQSWRNAAVAREVSSNEAAWAYYIPQEQLLRSKKPQVAPYTYLYPNVNWKDVMFKDYAKNSRVNMNVSGGTDFAKYFASVGYLHEGDLMASHYNTAKNYDPGYAYNRFNFRGNVDFNLTRTTVLSANLSGYFGSRKSPNATFGGSGTGHIFRGYYELAPDAFPVMYPDGTYGKDPANLNLNNPIAIMQEGGVAVSSRRQISSDIKLEQKLDFLTKGLSVSANVSYDQYIVTDGPSINDNGNQGQALYSYINPKILDAKTRQDTLNNTFYYATAGATGLEDFDWVMRPWSVAPEAISSTSLNLLERSLFYQASVNYARQFGKHDVTALALFNRRENATGGLFPTYREDWVGRLTYSYDSKYFAEINGAYNGSEKFGPKYRFGHFPSLALGWMVSNEKFMKKYEWLTKFKIRGSIGEMGNDAINNSVRWPYVGSWSTGGAFTTYDATGTIVNSPYTTYKEGTIPNQNIHWETAIKRNIAAEIALLDRLITLDIDLFKDNRKEIFMSADRRNVPNYFGATAVPANLGETQTKGYEVQLGINKKFGRNFDIWMKLGISRATDIVTKSEDPLLLPAYQKVVGFPIGQTKSQIRTQFMNNWNDVFASSPGTANMVQRLPGDWDINDFNGDGIINTYDSAPLGYTQRPQNTYNTTLGFNYKNFSCMVQFYGVNNITLAPYIMTPTLTRWTAVSEELRDYWTPQNTNAYFQAPRLTTFSGGGATGADWIYQDASYLRLKTAEIAYNLPANLVKTLGLSSCRVYINGNNLILWSKFPADFETGTVDIQNAYPTYRTFQLGIDVKF